MDTQFAIKYLKSVANSALVKQIQAHDEHPYSKIITEENLVHLVGSNEVNAWQHAYMAGLLSIKTNNGRLFGHITNKNIIDEVNKETKLINKYMFKENYKLGLGQQTVTLTLHKDVGAHLYVLVKEIN